jgi:hypothetical protein
MGVRINISYYSFAKKLNRTQTLEEECQHTFLSFHIIPFPITALCTKAA